MAKVQGDRARGALGLAGPSLLAAALGLATPAAAAASPRASAQRPTETGFVAVEPGVRLRYSRIGHGPEAVVVPMGFLLERSFRTLARKHRTLVLYDPRGRGRSDAVDPSRISFQNDLSDLEAIRRHFGLKKMALIGWSHYGMMTAVFAIAHPDRVTRLVQMTPGAPVRQPYLDEGMRTMRERVDDEAWTKLRERIEAGEFAKDREGACRASKRVTLEAFVGDRADVTRIPLDDCRLANEWEENQQRWWEALFRSMGDWDHRAPARALAVPRLVIQGEKDFIPLGGSREWVAGNARARLLVLPEVGHFPHVERPDLFFPAVDRFLDGQWPTGAEPVAVAAASPPGAEEEIRQAELARQEAVRKGDRAALERIYADDFVGVSSNGQVVDKGGVLALLGRTDPRLTLSTDELTARLMGPVGMAMGRITARGEDGNVVFAFRFLHLYEKRDGRWVTVAGQSTSLPP